MVIQVLYVLIIFYQDQGLQISLGKDKNETNRNK